MKKILPLFLLLLLCGCARERCSVIAAALDCDGETYTLTVQIASQAALDQPLSARFLTVQGKDWQALTEALCSRTGGELYLGGLQLLLLGKIDAAALLPPIASMCQQPTLRLALRPVSVPDDQAGALLQSSSDVLFLPQLIYDAVAAKAVPDLPLYCMTDALLLQHTITLPALRVDASGQLLTTTTTIFGG